MNAALGPPGQARGVAVAPALVAVAHGSRDPRSAATMSAVVDAVAAARPEVDVRLAFLDLGTPAVTQVVDAVAAHGHAHAVVVPLLLGSAFHARVDLPGLLDAGRAAHPRLRLEQAEVLGPDPRLIAVLAERVRAADPAGDPARRGVAVAAVGSSSPAANARTAAVARALTARTGWLTESCFATAEPGLPAAVARLRARGADRVVVAPWFLAPGLLTDRLHAAAPDAIHADVLGAHRAFAEVVWDRYDAAVTAALPLSA
ncbi:sirohydrochlorin chelatase [Nocardia farcinica]|uniref:sirohydrochlorin chelatase n=1 Tax=Nocardia farcinica TaxID=37329 RepID=UPI001894BE4A|nr:CbiX/SirB N-terminal domain-containing protein [Nocardia farcinica]MBF6442163.1 sirohydrochlorin chelatase [Nocardia farcinica]